MHVVPMERAWKDNHNHTNYAKSPNIDLRGFKNTSDDMLTSVMPYFDSFSNITI